MENGSPMKVNPFTHIACSDMDEVIKKGKAKIHIKEGDKKMATIQYSIRYANYAKTIEMLVRMTV